MLKKKLSLPTFSPGFWGLIFTFFAFFTAGCEGVPGDENTLPPSSGQTGELIMVIDTTELAGPLGEELKAIFGKRQDGILQGERIFTVRYIHPPALVKFLKVHKNLIFVTLTDKNNAANQKMREFFPKSGLEQIRKNPKLFMFPMKSVYAKDQQVLHLFGKNAEELMANLSKNREKLREVFAAKERSRLVGKLAKAKSAAEMDYLKEKHGFSFLLPAGFRKAKDVQEPDGRSGFLWYRHPEAVFDKNIVISYRPYRSEQQLDFEHVELYRDSLAGTHLFGDPAKPDSYILTEKLEPAVLRTTTVGKNYAVEMRGLWRTNNLSMGGSFISYTIVDQAKNRLYYIEGFVYAPGLNKREFIRELEAVIRTVR